MKWTAWIYKMSKLCWNTSCSNKPRCIHSSNGSRTAGRKGSTGQDIWAKLAVTHRSLGWKKSAQAFHFYCMTCHFQSNRCFWRSRKNNVLVVIPKNVFEVQSKLEQLKTRSLLDSFHVHLALAAVGQVNGEVCTPCEVADINLVGPAWKAPEMDSPSAGFHMQFVGQVFNWFRNLHWFSGCSAGDPCDISWVELFLFWVVDSGCVPPFKVDGKWVRVGVDEDAVCCVPSAYALFRTWRRAVSFVLRIGGLAPGNAVDSCSSAVDLGARFALSGLTWRPRVPLAVRRDLSVQFSSLARCPRCAFPLSGRRVWWTHGPQPR